MCKKMGRAFSPASFLRKKDAFFWILSKWGRGEGPAHFFAHFQEVHFSSIKGSISSKMPMIGTLNNVTTLRFSCISISIIDVVLMDLATISFIKPSTNSSEWAQQASHGFKATSNEPRWTSVIPLRTFRTKRDMMAIDIQIYIFIGHSVGCVCQFAKYQFSGIQCIKCRLWKYSTTCAYINRCHARSLETRKVTT